MPRKEIEVCCDEVLSASGNSGDVMMLRELGHLLIKFADPIPDNQLSQTQELYEAVSRFLTNYMSHL